MPKPFFGTKIDRLHRLGNPLSLHPMNEGAGSGLWDHGRNAKQGIINGAVWAGSPDGGALVFNGTTDYVSMLNYPILGDTWTIMAWAKCNVAVNPGFDTVITYRGSSANNLGGFWFHNGNNFHWRIGSTGAIFGGTWVQNKWHFIAVKRDSTNNGSLYVDGIEVDTATSFWSEVGTPELSIGRVATSHTDYLDGSVRFSAVYPIALSSADISQIYYNTYAMFESPSPERFFALDIGVPIPIFVRHYMQQGIM